MSTETQTQDPFAVIFHTAHRDAFLTKMAELGYPCQSQEDADAMLALGLRVQALPEQPVKTAQVASPYAKVLAALDSELVSRGMLDQTAVKSAEQNRAKAAAVQYAQHPEIYNAALTLIRARNAAQS